ncbi:MAG: hypothetical protein ACT4PP_15570 [Sporichthyaceae bacterium]
MAALETPTRGRRGAVAPEQADVGSARATEPAGPAGPRRRRRYLREPAPWRRSDLIRAGILAVIGLAVSVWGWFGVSGEVRLREQEVWVVVAMFGAVIAALGGSYLVLVCMREVRLGQRQLMIDIAEVMAWPVSGKGRVLDIAALAESAEVTGALVTGGGMTFVHHPDCPIVRGKATEPITDAEAQRRGLQRCGMCAP